jgi:ApaG protein
MSDIKISIQTESYYLPEQSITESNRFLWSYEITITNESDHIVQLLNRYWRITDLSGHIEEVKGPGVIGLQPIIKPGRKFAYSSLCQLMTPKGTMEGQYQMQTLDEVSFSIEIPKFALISPLSEAERGKLH